MAETAFADTVATNVSNNVEAKAETLIDATCDVSRTPVDCPSHQSLLEAPSDGTVPPVARASTDGIEAIAIKAEWMEVVISIPQCAESTLACKEQSQMEAMDDVAKVDISPAAILDTTDGFAQELAPREECYDVVNRDSVTAESAEYASAATLSEDDEDRLPVVMPVQVAQEDARLKDALSHGCSDAGTVQWDAIDSPISAVTRAGALPCEARLTSILTARIPLDSTVPSISTGSGEQVRLVDVSVKGTTLPHSRLEDLSSTGAPGHQTKARLSKIPIHCL